MERNSFIFYKGWREAIKDLPDDVRLEIYESIIEYATTGNLRGLKPMANIAFNFIKIDIDRDTEKYMSIVERNKQSHRLRMGCRRGLYRLHSSVPSDLPYFRTTYRIQNRNRSSSS